MRSFFARKIIGLDLGSSRVKAVVLQYRPGEDPVIRDYAVEEMAEGEPLDAVLRRLLKRLRTRSREVAVAMWPKGARLRYFDGAADRTLLDRVQSGTAAAADLFHEDLPDHVVACERLAITDDGTRHAIHVAGAIPRAEIAALEATLARLGCRIRSIQLTPLAILNAFAASQVKGRQPFLAVDFGRGKMTVFGVASGVMSFIHTIDFPWGEIPAPLVAVSGPGGEVQESGAAQADEATDIIFQEVTDHLAHELQPYMDAVRAREDMSALQVVHISGAVSNHRIAMRQLSEKIGLPFKQWNPIRHLAADGRALDDFSILGDIAHLPAAAGAAFQCAA